ncbi:hypothetical protein M0R45_008471 [Rubus argutus]|uniref:tRNA pseudouridine(55) synthase n=1 Tax=Rubus argutus TaxID=59490 RepID=A0AAW1Y4I7_RUBAR
MQKKYTAPVWTSRILQDEDLQSISSIKDMVSCSLSLIIFSFVFCILNLRAQHDGLASPPKSIGTLVIHWMRVEKIVGSSQYFLLHLCTQAGTYIKEFVHGDLGRTQPSFGSILGTRAEILRLDVTEVKMDCFLTE